MEMVDTQSFTISAISKLPGCRSFLGQVPFAIGAIVSVTLALKLPKREAEHFLVKLKRIDFAGAVVLVSGVFCLLLGLDRGGNVSWSDKITIGCLSAFGVLFALFIFVEMKVASEPFAPKSIVANPALVASYFANFFSAGTGLTLSFMVMLYFQAVQGRTAGESGVVLLPAILAGVSGSLISGIIMQATGKYYWLTFSVFAVMVLGQVLVPGFSGVWIYSYVGITIGVYFCPNHVILSDTRVVQALLLVLSGLVSRLNNVANVDEADRLVYRCGNNHNPDCSYCERGSRKPGRCYCGYGDHLSHIVIICIKTCR